MLHFLTIEFKITCCSIGEACGSQFDRLKVAGDNLRLTTESSSGQLGSCHCFVGRSLQEGHWPTGHRLRLCGELNSDWLKIMSYMSNTNVYKSKSEKLPLEKSRSVFAERLLRT